MRDYGAKQMHLDVCGCGISYESVKNGQSKFFEQGNNNSVR